MVVRAMVGEMLVDPLHLPVADAEGIRRHGVQVLAPAHVGDPGSRVAGPDVEEVRRGIVRARVPDGAATDLPRIGLPGLAAGLAGGGGGIPAPQALADRESTRLKSRHSQ